MKRFLRMAALQASRSGEPFRVGAVLMRGGSLLSRASNYAFRYGDEGRTTKAVHAERRALNAYPGDPDGGTMIVVRIKGDGSLAMSRPCVNCSKLLLQKNIRKVVYINWDGEQRLLRARDL